MPTSRNKCMLTGMKAAVYGLGRFGSFWAECLYKAGCEVIAYSRSEHPLPEGVRKADEEEVLTAPVLFFCVAISSFESVLKRVGSRIGRDTIVMDTCSVKIMPSEWMKENIPSDRTIIATHPMFGPDSARDGLAGLPVVTCPVKVDDETMSRLESVFTSWGLKVLRMTPLMHDKEAAYSQGVTHFVGRTLREMGLHDTDIATRGYKALMTIVDQTCNDPVQLFYDLQHYNPYAREMRLSLQVAVEKTLNRLRESEEGMR